MKYNIIYVIPFAEDIRPPSIFQGFSSGLLDIYPFINKILNLPQNVFELFSTWNNIASIRMSGYSGYSILPIDKSFINDISLSDDHPFLCIFSNEQTIQEVENFINQNKHQVLHVSTQESETGILFDDFKIEHISSYIEEVMKVQPLNDLHSFLAQSEKHLLQLSKEKISLKRRFHLVTEPNEIALSSLGFELEGDDNLPASTTDTPYIDAITRSAQVIFKKREDISLSGPMGISLILTSPSKVREFYRMKVSVKTVTGLDASKSVLQILRQIQRQTQFSLKVESDDFKKSLSEPSVKFLFAELAAEARVYTMALSIMACNYFAPVLRMPPAVNTIHNDLISLGSCARGSSINQHFKMNKIFRRITKRLISIVDPAYLTCIDQDSNTIKVICDAPLEWLPIRNLPLMLRFNTSRVPTTPGNLFFHLTIMNQQITLPLQAFEEILIIRSFREDDKIRKMLEQAVDIAQNRAEKKHKYTDKSTMLNIRIKWVDVSDEEEFVRALNEFSGAVMIFDGHGTHKKNADFGSLV